MMLLARALASMAIVGYALIWTGLALVMLLTWDAPRSWVAWMVVIVNPLTAGVLAALVSGYLRETYHHG